METSSTPDYAMSFCGEAVLACASGALFWPSMGTLCVSDLHFGKASRFAVQGGAGLPPYDTLDTLTRLDRDVATYRPARVICLGDSFDALSAVDDLDASARDWITRLQAGRKWIWIEGNHDPGPIGLGGTHLAEWRDGPLVFRHIAEPRAQSGEISGHYHPKATVPTAARSTTRACFAVSATRIIMPAYGTYTGGLDVCSTALSDLLDDTSICVLTGPTARPVPLRALKRRGRLR